MSYQLSKAIMLEDSIAIGLFSDISEQALLTKEQQQQLEKIISLSQFDAKAGKILTQYAVAGFAAKRIILFGLGKKQDYSLKNMRKALTALGKELVQYDIKKLAILLPEEQLEANLLLRQAVIALEDANICCDGLKQKPAALYWPDEIIFALDENHAPSLKEGEKIAEAIKLTKYLGNLPANICTPRFLAQEATELSKNLNSIKTTIYDEHEIHNLKMGCFLAVAQGSIEPPRLIVMEYQGNKK